MRNNHGGAVLALGLAMLSLAGCRVANEPTSIDGNAAPVGATTAASTPPPLSTAARATAPPTPTSTATPTATSVPGDLPRGFLLHEAEASADPLNGSSDHDGWYRSDQRTERWHLQPCQARADYATDGARAARTLVHLTYDATFVEQVVVYRDAQAAVDVMAEMREWLRLCAHDTAGPATAYRYTLQPVSLGGEAIRVLAGSDTLSTQGEMMIIVRRGAAIALYGAFGEIGHPTAASTRDIEAQAARMSDRFCRYTLAGC